MNHPLELTVLMPCLNEAETLAACIRKAQAAIEKSGAVGEVVVADNGSTDGSVELAERLGARVVRVNGRGYGNALRGGMLAARGRFIIMADADDSYDFGALEPFLERLRQGFDFVMGCRMPAGGGTVLPGAMPWKHRWIGNPVLTFIGRLLFKCPSHDFHCGMRALTRRAFDLMDLRTSGMEFASEMIVKASLLHLRIAEVPVTLHKDGRSRPPHLRSWRDGWRHLRFLLLFSPRWLFFYPGLIAMVIGGGIFFRLWLGGALSLGRVTLDVHTLEVAALVLTTGWEMVLFACFVRIYAHIQKFLPSNELLKRAFSIFNLERGLIAGAAVLLLGLGILAASTLGWVQSGFGPLDSAQSIRNVIAGRFFASVGIQTILFSLVFSYLGIHQTSGAAD